MNHYFTNNNNLKSDKKIIKINFNNQNISLYTDNGVFSKEHFDYGSKLLINNFIKEEKNGRVLDLGCGYGVIGIILSQNKKLFIDMVDINERAIKLSNENIKLNNIKLNRNNRRLKMKVSFSHSLSITLSDQNKSVICIDMEIFDM